MKKFKKILSLTLALALCLSVAVPAFANDNEEIRISENIGADQAIVEEDLTVLRNIGLVGDLNRVSIVGTDSDGNIIYNISFSDTLSSNVTIQQDENGNTQVNINENGKTNTVVFIGDEIYVDGSKVSFGTVETYYDYEDTTPASRAFVPYTYYSKTPLYGRPSDYSTYLGTTVVRDISVGLKWRNATISVLAIVLETACIANSIPCPSSDILNDIAQLILDAADPTSELDAYISFSRSSYAPATQPAMQIQSKIVGAYYSQANLAGIAQAYTYYEGYYYG